MGDEGARKTPKAQVISSTPDVCKTPVGSSLVPVPYPITGYFNASSGTESKVFFTGEEAFTTASKVTQVVGDEAGTGGGVKSGVNKSTCEPITSSSTVRTGGNPVVRDGDTMWMNDQNTTGKVVFPAGPGASVSPSGEIFDDTNPPIELTEQEQSWWEQASPWVHGALDVAGLVPGVGEIADGVNALIYLGEENLIDAGISAAAMIPIAGWGATGAKVVKHGDEAIALAKQGDEVAQAIGRNSDEVVDAASDTRKASGDGPDGSGSGSGNGRGSSGGDGRGSSGGDGRGSSGGDGRGSSGGDGRGSSGGDGRGSSGGDGRGSSGGDGRGGGNGNGGGGDGHDGVKVTKKDLAAPKEITQAAQAKGDKFFKGFAKRNPTNQTTRQIGDYTEFSIDVPGDNGQSFTRWVKVVGPDGRTTRLYHDTFDNTGKFLNRGIKVPGPERHVK